MTRRSRKHRKTLVRSADGARAPPKMPVRGPGGRFLPRSTPAIGPVPGSGRQPSKAIAYGTHTVPVPHAELVASMQDLPERPACFGNCAEMSSACDACPVYNPRMRATMGDQ